MFLLYKILSIKELLDLLKPKPVYFIAEIASLGTKIS
jgi:hypothetical protein